MFRFEIFQQHIKLIIGPTTTSKIQSWKALYVRILAAARTLFLVKEGELSKYIRFN